MFFGSLLLFFRAQLSLPYFCLYCTPFYATPLINSHYIGTMLMPVQLAGLMLLIWMLVTQKGLNKQMILKVVIILSPFLVALLYNYFFFEPVMAWETDGDKRVGYSKINMRYSLNSTNITQLIYIVFGLVMFVLFSSLQLSRKKLQKSMDYAMYVVSFAGAFQLVAYYSGFHDIYKTLFCTLQTNMPDQTIIWGIKRINATLGEPSYLGHYVFFNLLFYVCFFGYRKFLASKAVYAATIIGLLSTATTFYVGFLVLIVLLYLYFASDQEKMVYYIAFIFIGPVVVYLGYDFATTYLDAKHASTDERWLVSWTLAWEGFYKSPFFGYAYGTSRPLFIYTQLLFSVGILGTLMFLFGIFYGGTNRMSRIFLLGVFAIGLAAFEITRHEMWIYFGLLSNRYIYDET